MAHTDSHLTGRTSTPSPAAERAYVLPWRRKTEKAEGAQEPPAGRLSYPERWGSWPRCHRHNLRWPLCPTKTRCMICRVLSRVGWGFIHLSLRVAGRKPYKVEQP